MSKYKTQFTIEEEKPVISSRPIVSSIDSPLCGIAQYLQNILKPSTFTIETNLTCKDFLDKLKQLSSKNYTLISY